MPHKPEYERKQKLIELIEKPLWSVTEKTATDTLIPDLISISSGQFIIFDAKYYNAPMKKTYTLHKWYDRNIIYGENTIFWKEFIDIFKLTNINDMGRMLNEGGVQLEFVSSSGTISQNNID